MKTFLIRINNSHDPYTKYLRCTVYDDGKVIVVLEGVPGSIPYTLEGASLDELAQEAHWKDWKDAKAHQAVRTEEGSY